MTKGLNLRQRKGMAFVKAKGRIANADYQRLTEAIRKTATRDLDDMVRGGYWSAEGRDAAPVMY